MKKTVLKIFLAAWLVAAVSMIVTIYGLESVVFFNKTAVSLGTFFLGILLSSMCLENWQESRRDCLISYGMAFGLVFTEVLGTAMRLEVTKGGVALTPLGGVCSLFVLW